MSWLEVEPGMLVNLEQVKFVENRGMTSRIYFTGEDTIDANVMFDFLKSMIRMKSSNENDSAETNLTLKRILSQTFTPVP